MYKLWLKETWGKAAGQSGKKINIYIQSRMKWKLLHTHYIAMYLQSYFSCGT